MEDKAWILITINVVNNKCMLNHVGSSVVFASSKFKSKVKGVTFELQTDGNNINVKVVAGKK